ncbi:MAG: hypothetical protein M0P31_15385 [Solirubrobacteraceae bacterium]|nr:hypothetical protein [Solirubrobacteraceae bacterium]
MSADRQLLDSIPNPVLDAVIATVDEATLTCMVRVPAWDGGRGRYGPAPYLPAGEDHPSRDDRCVLLETPTGALWVACWTAEP